MLSLRPSYIRNHKVSVAILLFMTMMMVMHIVKPAFVYNKDGSFRQFGIGYRNNTIIPVWAVSIVLAIGSYLVVLCV